jgi:uncharacterized membrane protein YcaP (DUF421 family)
MGKRQIGQMEPSEFVVTMLAANLASIPIQDGAIPLLTGIVPIVTILGIELVLSSLCLRSMGLRRLLCGKPVILIEEGRILQQNLRKTRVTMDELTEALREKDVLDLRSVQYAILETNGKVSVLLHAKDYPASAREAGIQVKPHFLPITIISDGKLLKTNLKLAGRDDTWLAKVLRARDATVGSTWLLTVDHNDRILWYPREESL